jgi:hypothetical protein
VTKESSLDLNLQRPFGYACRDERDGGREPCTRGVGRQTHAGQLDIVFASPHAIHPRPQLTGDCRIRGRVRDRHAKLCYSAAPAFFEPRRELRSGRPAFIAEVTAP